MNLFPSLSSRLSPVLLALALFWGPPRAQATPAPPDGGAGAVLRAIDAARAQGAIDEATRQAWRVALVRAPDRLPTALRRLLRAPTGRRTGPPLDGSAILREAFTWVHRNQAWGGAVHNLLQPPGDLPFVLDSDRLPIRITYRDEWDVSLAQAVLDAAEHSWDVAVGQFGFRSPLTLDATGPAGRYRYFVDTTGMGGGGYTAPYDLNPATPWTDCFTYIVVDPANPDYFVPGVVAHESNHAMQAATDCLEVTTFWENTAVYVAAAIYASEWSYAIQTMPYFQSQPWRALDYMSQPRSDLYEYGGGLFLFWLTDAYAQTPAEPWPSLGTDGPVLVREIWEASMETAGYNEPDYYDAIEQVLADRGHAVRMEDVLLDFSEARYFVGSRDDGRHIRNADAYEGAELVLVDEVWPNELPLRDGAPREAFRPAPFGSNHILIHTPTGIDAPLRVTFDGEDETRWRVRLVPVGAPEAAVEIPLTSETWDGSALLAHQPGQDVLMVVANLGTRSYDPDARQWPTATYRYAVQLDLPPPSLEAIVPASVVRGQQGLVMRLRGSGFLSGPDFFLRFDDPNLQVASVSHIAPTEVTFELTVPRLTTPGLKTVRLTNGDGTEAVGVDLLEVLASDGPTTPTDPSKPGCGCRGAGSEPPAGIPWVGLVLLGLLWRRRRTGTSR